MSDHDLFRKEAVEARQRVEGEVILASPPASWSVLTVLLFICVMGLGLLAFGQYARQETVKGWVVPEMGVARVTSQTGGVISEVYVEVGDSVQAGQPVAKISLDITLLDGQGAAETALVSLDEQILQLENSLEGVRVRNKLEQANLQRRQAALASEATQLVEQIRLQEERLALAKRQLESVEDLIDQDAASVNDLQRRQEAVIIQQQALADFRQRKVALDNEFAAATSESQVAPIASEIEISNIKRQLADLRRQRAESAMRGEYQLVASRDGQIASILLTSGSSIRAGQTILTVLPGGGNLQAQLFAPTRAAGFIKPGQEVDLLYDAFPYQQFGVGEGIVKSISRTILDPDDLIEGPQVNEPVYRVIVDLGSDKIEAFGETFPLQPGMALQGRIILERRPLWSWIVAPLRRE